MASLLSVHTGRVQSFRFNILPLVITTAVLYCGAAELRLEFILSLFTHALACQGLVCTWCLKCRHMAALVANELKSICIKIVEYFINVPSKSPPKTSNVDVYRFLISFVVSEK